MKVRYETRQMPPGVPAVVVARHGDVLILVDEGLSAAELCDVLTPLITAHAADCWTPQQAIA